MGSEPTRSESVAARISLWLSVPEASQAVRYYTKAFGAVEVERLEDEHGCLAVAQLSIGGAIVRVQGDRESSPEALGGRAPVRMILTVEDPDAVFVRAVEAGGTEIAPVHEEHGWRVGRIVDPSGHHWEIGKRLTF